IRQPRAKRGQRPKRRPGFESSVLPRPERPKPVGLIPNVTFVVLHLVSFQDPPKLFLKRNLSVMLLLAGNVLLHERHLRLPNRESPIAILPSKATNTLALHPA